LHGSNVVLLLAGALEVIDYQRQPKPRIKYYGCFLFENHLVIARARRTTHYEIVERLNLEKMTIARLNRDPGKWYYLWDGRGSLTRSILL
jgi:hypothetical protein